MIKGKRKLKRRKEWSAGGIVVHPSGNKVLLVRSKSGRKGWGLPKGHLRRNENPMDAAKREIEEETGLPRKHLFLRARLPAVHQFISYARSREFVSRQTHFFLFSCSTDVLSICRHDEAHDKVRWVTWNEVSRLPLRYKYVKNLLIKGEVIYRTSLQLS